MLVLSAQGAFFMSYLLVYIASPKLAHRIVGYLEEEAIVSYTSYLEEIDEGVCCLPKRLRKILNV